MRSLHRSRLLAFCSCAAALAALGMPYSYYLMSGRDGRTQFIDHWGADSFNALCFATLLMPVLLLALIGPRAAPPRRMLAWFMTGVGGLALLLSLALLVGYATTRGGTSALASSCSWPRRHSVWQRASSRYGGLPSQTALDLADRFCFNSKRRRQGRR